MSMKGISNKAISPATIPTSPVLPPRSAIRINGQTVLASLIVPVSSAMETARASINGVASSLSAEKNPARDVPAIRSGAGLAGRNADESDMRRAQSAATPQAPIMFAEPANANPTAAGITTQAADTKARTVALIAAPSLLGSPAVSARTLTKMSELTDWKNGIMIAVAAMNIGIDGKRKIAP